MSLSGIAAVIDSAEFRARLREAGLSAEAAEAKIKSSLAEAEYALEMLADVDLKGKRVLEVGAGIGVLSARLAAAGADITALEPAEAGFEENASLAARVRDRLGARHPVLACGAEDLDPEKHGRFDVIFSLNVLEHVRDLDRAISAMYSVLAPGGFMLHQCPNYALPYEPHYRIWLVPFVPKWTEAFARGALADRACWDSLNFVTHRRVKRAAAKLGRGAEFRPGMLRETFARFDRGDDFSRRQSGWPARVHAALRRMKLLEMTAKVPAAWATPMRFRISKPGKRA